MAQKQFGDVSMVEKMLQINIEKSPMPLIWLDSSIIIHMTKAKVGEKIDVELKKRVGYLYNTIRKFTREKKLLCPLAEQEEEVELGDRLEDECRKILIDLSLGIVTKCGIEIEDYLISIFMKAYIENSDTINLSYKDIFRRDPIRELDERLKDQFIVNVHIPKTKDFLEDIKKSKVSSHTDYERLRCQNISNGVNFEEQLKIEFRGTHDGLIEKIRRFNEKIKNKKQIDCSEFLGVDGIVSYGNCWDSFKGEPPGLNGLFQFLLSDYHNRVPRIEIMCNLFAKILTGTTPVKSGDSMDIQQLSCILPYFDMIITDKTMKYYIETLEFQKKYNTKVFALKNFDEIRKYFKNL